MGMYGVVIGSVLCGLLSFYMFSFLFWASLLVGAGILFSLSVSLVNTQVEFIISTSMGFISGGFSSAMVLLTLWVYLMSFLVSDKVSKNQLRGGYLSLLSLLTIICCIFFSVGDYFFMYLFFEGVLIPIIFMILGWGRQPERFEAGLYMLIYTVMGSFPLLVCLFWFWGLNMSSCFLLGGEPNSFFQEWLVVFMVSLAFCVKMPIFSVHGWLPKAHVEAPVAGSMMLAGILLKMGVYGLVMFYWFMKVEFVWLFEFFSVVGAVGGMASGFICLYQSDMKALIAYSSISHMCFLMIGLVSLGWIGWEGVILMALSHGICSPWLFFLANYLSDSMGTRSLFLLKGMLLSFPMFSFLMFLGICSNMAVPPCVALIAELSLFMSGVYFSMSLILPIMLMCFVAAAYSLGLYSAVNHGGLISSSKMENEFSSRCVLGSAMAISPLMFGVLVVDLFSWSG